MSRVNWKNDKFLRTCGDVSVCSRSNWSLEVGWLVFKKWRKRSTPGEKFSEQQGREPPKNSTQIWRPRPDLVLSPPRHPPSSIQI